MSDIGDKRRVKFAFGKAIGDVAFLTDLGIAQFMTAPRKTVRRREGDFVVIDLGDSKHSYAQVAAEPLMLFFDGRFANDLPVLFRLWVSNYAITRGRWPIICRGSLAPENEEEPFFYKQDAITGKLALYHSSFAQTNWERPATFAECEALECAAIWEPEHVEDRLRDHYAGQPNRWLESLQIDVSAIA
jgi:hypothetical protein